MTTATKNFKARVNVNIVIPVEHYPEVKANIKAHMERIAEFEPGANKITPTSVAYRPIMAGTVLTFGDKIELTDDGLIAVYPVSLFDSLKDRKVEMPCRMEGAVSEQLKAALNLLPEEERNYLESKRNNLTSRFIDTPIIERLKD